MKSNSTPPDKDSAFKRQLPGAKHLADVVDDVLWRQELDPGSDQISYDEQRDMLVLTQGRSSQETPQKAKEFNRRYRLAKLRARARTKNRRQYFRLQQKPQRPDRRGDDGSARDRCD
jgi:hypothetical protein